MANEKPGSPAAYAAEDDKWAYAAEDDGVAYAAADDEVAAPIIHIFTAPPRENRYPVG